MKQDLEKKIMKIVEDMMPNLNGEEKEKCKKLVDNAEKSIVIATENGAGFVGSSPAVVACWQQLTFNMIKNDNLGEEFIKYAFDVVLDRYHETNGNAEDMNIEKELKDLKGTLDEYFKEETNEDTKDSNSLEDKLKEINDLLEELK